MLVETAVFAFFIISFIISVAVLSNENQYKLDAAYRKTKEILKNKLGIDVPESKIKVVGVTPKEYEEKEYIFSKVLSPAARFNMEIEKKQREALGVTVGGCTQYSPDKDGYEVVVPVDDKSKEFDIVYVLSHEIGGHVFQNNYGALGKAQNSLLFEEAKKRKILEDAISEYMKSGSYEDYEEACVLFFLDCYTHENPAERMNNPELKAKFVENFLREKQKETEKRAYDYEDEPGTRDSDTVKTAEKIRYRLELCIEALKKLIPLEHEYRQASEKLQELPPSDRLREGWARTVEKHALKEYAKQEGKDEQDVSRKIRAIDEIYARESGNDAGSPQSSLALYAEGMALFEKAGGNDFERKKQIALKSKSDTELEAKAGKAAASVGISQSFSPAKEKALSG